MKHIKLLICLAFLVNQSLSGQEMEHMESDSTHFIIRAWEDYYQQKAAELGTSVWQKGSGYKAFSRYRQTYDQLKQDGGRVYDRRRFQLYKQVRQHTLNDRTPRPVADWTNIGPQTLDGQGGRMISHAFDPQHSDTIWAGSASGGLWRSLNGGDWWEPMTDQIPSTGVGAVAIHPDSSHIILIGTGEGFLAGQRYNPSIRGGIGVLKSVDFGLTWQSTSFDYPRAIEVSALSMVWDKHDVNVVWLGATNGLWKSIDQGQHWNQILGDGTNHGGFIIDDIVLHPTNSDTVWVAIEGSGIVKSADGGLTWDLLGNGLPFSDLNFISLDICRDQPDVLYANISSGPTTGFGLKGIYRTEDGGQSWQRLSSAPSVQCSPQFINFCQGWYNNTIAVSPINPQEVLIGGVTAWMSQDGGLTWSQKDRLICTNCVDAPPCTFFVDQHDIGYDPDDPERIFIFNDGGVARSEDGGACWVEINAGLITTQFYAIASAPTNPNLILGGFQDHGLQGVNLSDGLEWKKWGFLDGSDVAVHPTNENILYGSWFDGTYWKSVNGLNTLAAGINNGINLSENSSTHFAPLRVHPFDGKILLGSTQQNIYISPNGGSTWIPKQAVNNVTEVAFSQVDPSICYAGAWMGNSWSFWRSEDTGETWQQTPAAPGWRLTDIKTSGQNANTVFACRNSSVSGTAHVYRSLDRGDSWQPIQGDMPDILVHGMAVNSFDDQVIYVGTDLGVFITIDGGTTWTEYNDQLPISYVLDIQFVKSDTTLIIGTHGRGAWRTKAYMPLNSSVYSRIDKNAPDITLFPNPNHGDVNLEMKIQNAAEYRIELYSQQGQIIRELYRNKLSAGQHELKLNISSIPYLRPGVYFIKVSNKIQAQWKKMILIN